MTQRYTDDPEAIPGAKIVRKGIVRAYTIGTHKADVQIVGSHPTLLTVIRVATDIPAADVVVGRQCTVLFLDPSNQDDALVLTIQGALPSGGGGGGGTPSGTVESEETFGLADDPGLATEYSRGDHTHGSPTNPVPAHAALDTGVHGAGASTLATEADIATHAALPDVHHAQAHSHALDHAPIGALYPGVLSTGLKPPQVPYRGSAFTIDKLYCRVSVAPQTTAITVEIRRNGASMGTVTIAAAAQTGETDVNVAVTSGDYFDINITATGTTPNEGSDLVWLVVP